MSIEPEDSSKEQNEVSISKPPMTRFCENGVEFYPPAYIQRYGDVCDILKNDNRWAGKIQKVVDFGCAELSLFTFLKNIPKVSTILEVDFDEDLLRRSHDRAEPLFYDHLFPRKTPLTVSVLRGSVADPDYRLIGCDAVLCIEIIEHLDPWAFDRMPHNIFGYIRPRLAFVTTPNADFNVLFPNLKEGNFRHWDHRFEWTREEFKDWAENVVIRYPDYTVEMIGVAPGPEGTEHLGCCSQMALFINQNYVKEQDINIVTYPETENVEEGHASDKEVKQNCDDPKNEVQIDETAQCLPIIEGKVPSDSDGEGEEVTNNNESAVVRFEHFSFYEGKEQNTVQTNEDQVKLQWDCRVWENPGVCQYYKTIMEYVYPFECDPRSREQKVVDEAMFRADGFSYCYDGYYDEVNDQWCIPLDALLDRMTNMNIELDELRTILSDAKHNIQDDKLIYVKAQRSSSSDASLEEDNAACQVDNTFDIEAGDSNYREPDWNVSDDEDQSWEPQNDQRTTSSLNQQAPDIQESIADQFADEVLDNLNDSVTLYTGLLGDSATSVPDDRSRPDSPLAQFLGANRDATEEQRLSDSGYLKSQDSPQSPVYSDSFSNDLITPDKDFSEMMAQSTILECIPENLNFPTSCYSPKDPSKPSESRRRSIGPMTGPDPSRADSEFISGPSMSRPKSLHTCTTSYEYSQNVRNEESPSLDNSQSPIANFLSPETNFQRNDLLQFDNIQRHFNLPPRPQINHDLRHNDFDVLPQNNHDLRHNEFDVMPQNNHDLRRNDFEVRERLVRPDFLQIQNLEVAVVDHLNNNVDFEGNNFGAEQRERGDAEVERVHLFEADFMDHADNLLLGHLDRHNENHILDEFLHQHHLLHQQLHHQLHQEQQPEQEEGVIMEAVLEYRENFQGNENDELNPGALVDIPLDSQDTLSNTPLRDEGDDDNSLETNYLLESIAKTLSLNSQHSFYTVDAFPSCSFQVTQDRHLRSPKHFNLLSKFHENEASLENLEQASSFFENDCDLTNILQENDSIQCLNYPERESSFLEIDRNLPNELQERKPLIERDGVYLENKYKNSEKYITRMQFFPGMVDDNITTASKMHLDELTTCSDNAILQKKLSNLTGTNADGLPLARPSEPLQISSHLNLNDEGSLKVSDESLSAPNSLFIDLNKYLDILHEEGEVTNSLAAEEVDGQVSTDLTDEELTTQLAMDNSNSADVPSDTGGAGDGVGVHSHHSTHSLGHASVMSNHSSTNSAGMGPSEHPTISSHDLAMFYSIPPLELASSSAASSDQLPHTAGVSTGSSRLLDMIPEDIADSSLNSSILGDMVMVNSSVSMSDISSYDADIETDSDGGNVIL